MRTNSISSVLRIRKAPQPRITLTVQYAVARRGLPAAAAFRGWARAALFESAHVTLRLIGEYESRALNSVYRHRNHATNVLTFPYADTRPVSGDIALCVPVARREARAQGKMLRAHLAHLTVHGMLHLQGYDHEVAAEAELMEGLETEIIAKLGYADPYRWVDRRSLRR